MELGSRYGPPLERREDGSLYQMTDAQQKLAARLVEKNCCNYWNGSCLLLEDGEMRSCPQRISYSVCCWWFRNAVLPSARELEAEIFNNSLFKRCVRCGKKYLPGSNRSLYCPYCASMVRRQKDRERKWKMRHECPHLGA